MKILLTAINAKYIHSNLAIYSLRAYAKEYRNEIELAEFTINNRSEQILSEIYKKRPDILMFSCYIWNIELVMEVASEFHKLCPDVPIWVGGPEVSYEVEDFLKKNPYITGIMMGEGEKIFRNVCAYYVEQKGGLSEIRGLAWRKEDGEICVNPWEDVIDMSTIPFAYEDMEDFKNKIIYYETSRGCPFRCSYCLSSVEKSLRFRSMELVKKELGFFIDQKVPQVKFVDRTFNCDKEHAMEIWRFIKKRDKGITNFHFEVAADILTDEEIEFIATMRPGLIQLEIGVQSTNEATIEEIRRSMKLDKVKAIVERVKAPGNIHQHLDLIAGLPYEDAQRFKISFDDIYALKPQQLQLGFLKVLKGSYMYENREKYELVYTSRPPYEVLRTKWLSYDEILKIKQVEEMLEVYYNSGQYPLSIRLLETFYDSAYAMFEALGAYYEEKGYFHISHTRIRRLEILLDFVRIHFAEAIDCFEAAAVCDLYARENAKSRPKWADDLSEWKEISRNYCKKGKLSHVERCYYEWPKEDTWREMPQRLEVPQYRYYDYEKRSRLDHQAEMKILDHFQQNTCADQQIQIK